MTRVFAAEFDNRDVAMESNASTQRVHGLEVVASNDRPSVSSFFEIWGDRCVVVNGVMVSGIAHDVCVHRVMTGDVAEGISDWPSLIASASSKNYTLPHLVLGGPSFPGALGRYVARAGQSGQLAALLSGELLEWGAEPVQAPSSPSVGIVDRYLARRSAARAAAADSAVDRRLAEALDESIHRALELKDYRYIADFSGGEGLEQQVRLATEALSLGLSRCVTLGHPSELEGAAWDTHSDNDENQSILFEGLFEGLGQLMEHLENTPGEVAATLAEETTVVVMSEMGRSPQLNGGDGKDHWPYTSALLIGSGLDGGRMISGFNDQFRGEPIDLATGESYAKGEVVSTETLGATLLALCGIDPAEHLGASAAAIEGILT